MISGTRRLTNFCPCMRQQRSPAVRAVHPPVQVTSHAGTAVDHGSLAGAEASFHQIQLGLGDVLRPADPPTSTVSLQSLPSFASHRKSTGIRQLLIGFAAAGVAPDVGVLTGAPSRVEAKTAAAGQKLSPGEPVLQRELLFHGK